ncbi:MAG: DUF4352 domain-containing protein [Clostridia bacterium]|nr:DUF4352 domain-containing protein [Clostridia bacterium]
MQNLMDDPKNKVTTKNKISLPTIILIVLGAVIFSILLITFFIGDESSGKKNEPSQQIFTLNDTVTINNSYKVKIDNVSTKNSIEYYSNGWPVYEYPNNNFLVVEFTITNIKKEEFTISEGNFTLTMEGGYQYSPSYILSSKGFTIAPLDTITFTIVFDVVYLYTEKNYNLTFEDYLSFTEDFLCIFQLY